MGVVVKEYRCLGHGTFESSDEPPRCPAGCEAVERIFLSPPGFRSSKTANIDKTVEDLARRHNLSDISNRGGKAAITQSVHARRQQEEFGALVRERYGSGWGAVPPGGTLNVQTGKIEGSGPGAAGAIAQYGARPDNVLADPAVVAALAVKKPVILKKDHENLKVDVSKAPA